MDREIKFRGKVLVKGISNIKRGDWIYGGITYDDNRLRIDTPYFGPILVEKETVGQYTGIDDKYGKEIYEGDIIKITYRNSKIILTKPLIAQIVWSEEHLAYILITTSVKDAFENLGDYLDYDIEVIGNEFDNPDLVVEE